MTSLRSQPNKQTPGGPAWVSHHQRVRHGGMCRGTTGWSQPHRWPYLPGELTGTRSTQFVYVWSALVVRPPSVLVQLRLQMGSRSADFASKKTPAPPSGFFVCVPLLDWVCITQSWRFALTLGRNACWTNWQCNGRTLAVAGLERLAICSS